MNLLDIVKPEVEVCVVGAGAGGPALGKHLSDAGIGVVILEAGGRYDPNTDYSDLPVEMTFIKFGFYRERRAHPFMLDGGSPILDPQTGFPIPNKFGFLITSMGVGGTTLQYYGNHPRAHYNALDEWDSGFGSDATLPGGHWRDELAPYFTKLEKELPVPNAPMGYGPFDTHNAMTLVGAANFQGLAEGDIDANLADFLPIDQNDNFYIPMYDAKQYDPIYTSYGELDPGGYRGQPNNMTTNCWHCGLCQVGCHKPASAQLKDKVKRATNVSFIPEGEKLGMEVREKSVAIAVLHPSSSIPQLEDLVGFLPNLVVYGTYSFGPDGLPKRDESTGAAIIDSVWVQPAHVVVFAAGTTETPRLWLQTNWLLSNDAVFAGTVQGIMAEYQATLPPEVQGALAAFDLSLYDLYVHQQDGDTYSLPLNQHVGQNLMTHLENFTYGLYNKPVEVWVGQNSQARVDIPGLGMIEAVGSPSPATASFVAFAKDIRVNPETGLPIPDPVFNGPYDMPMVKFGLEGKRLIIPPDPQDKIGGWRHALIFSSFAEDDPLDTNRVFLDAEKTERYAVPAMGMNLEVPVLAVQYHPSEEASERSRKLTKIMLQMSMDVEKATPADGLKLLRDQYNRPMLYNLNMEAATIFHSMGTMGMGKVVNSDCEAMDSQGNPVRRVFVADSCVFPNTLGGPNPAHTIQAMAMRTAEAIARKYLLSEYGWRKWKEKVGSENFRF